jgi:hypothetical protein
MATMPRLAAPRSPRCIAHERNRNRGASVAAPEAARDGEQHAVMSALPYRSTSLSPTAG